MKESKKQLERAIVILGESLNMKEATELLLTNVGIFSTVKELTYRMFVENKQQCFEKKDRVYDAISLIRTYCQEMYKNGEVVFEEPSVKQLERYINHMETPTQIENGEWIYKGCFIQESKHPKLEGNYEVFKNNKEQNHVGRCYTFDEAKKLCEENECFDDVYDGLLREYVNYTIWKKRIDLT